MCKRLRQGFLRTVFLGCTVVAVSAALSVAQPRDARAAISRDYGSGSGFCAHVTSAGYTLGANFGNVYTCGPGGVQNFSDPPFENANFGFQCVELANRYLWVTYGINPVGGGSLVGGNFVQTVHAANPSVTVTGSGTTTLPSAGDIISMWGGSSNQAKDGDDTHVAVVTSVTGSSAAGWTITVMEENASPGGSNTITVSADGSSWSYDNGFYKSFEWLNLAPASSSVDTTPPSVSCVQSDGLWHSTNVALECTASDGGSGLANPNDGSFTLPTSVAPGTENGNATTGSVQVCDNVGNCVTAGPIAGNKIDMRAPDVICASPDDNWHGANVTLTCTASDGGSGLANGGDSTFQLTTTVPLGTEVANASTDSQQVCDNVGNCSSAGPLSGIKVDLKAPDTAIMSPIGAGTTSKPKLILSLSTNVRFTVTDGGSGVASWTLKRHMAGAVGTTCRSTWRVDRTITGTAGGTDISSNQKLGLGRCYYWTLDSVDAVGNSSTQVVSDVIRTPKLARVS